MCQDYVDDECECEFDCADLMAASVIVQAKMEAASPEEREAAWDVCNYLAAAVMALSFGDRPLMFDDQSILAIQNFVHRRGKPVLTVISGNMALNFARTYRPAIHWVDVSFSSPSAVAA